MMDRDIKLRVTWAYVAVQAIQLVWAGVVVYAVSRLYLIALMVWG